MNFEPKKVSVSLVISVKPISPRLRIERTERIPARTRRVFLQESQGDVRLSLEKGRDILEAKAREKRKFHSPQ